MSSAISIQVSDRTLEETPSRVTAFLSGIGAVPEIRAILAGAGLTDADLAEGRKLLIDFLSVPPTTDTSSPIVRTQRDALAEVDQWDEPNFQRARAVLTRFNPSAAEYVFHDLSASRGIESVRGVLTFMARLDALETGSDPLRAATAAEDKKAIQMLAKRGINKAERQRITDLAHVALGSGQEPAPEQSPYVQARLERLMDLRRWYEDWSSTARAVIEKRAHLIRIGLGRRQNRTSSTPSTTPTAGAAANSSSTVTSGV